MHIYIYVSIHVYKYKYIYRPPYIGTLALQLSPPPSLDAHLPASPSYRLLVMQSPRLPTSRSPMLQVAATLKLPCLPGLPAPPT